MGRNQIGKSLVYDTINLLRFPMVVLVVFIHTCGCFSSDDYSYISYYLIRAIFSNLMEVAVPVFFVISGFLFYRRLENWKWEGYICKLRRRIHSLLIPYLIWNTCYILFALLGTIFAVLIKGISFSVLTDWYHSEGFYALYWGGPYLFPFWYIRDLMVLVVISPVIYGCVKYASLFFIVVLGVVCFFLNTLPSSTFFFSLGAYSCLAERYRFLSYKWFRLLIIICYILLLLIRVSSSMKVIESIEMVDILVVPVGVVAIFCIGYKLLEIRWIRPNKLLSESSFFIFAFHAFLITDCSRLIGNLVGADSQIKLIIDFFFLPFIIVFFCILIYLVLRKVFPSTMLILTGGR